MRLRFFTLDVFTQRKFAGNPLAVVLGADELSAEQMQTICREFNLSETTFVMKPESAGNTAKMRIFFPGGEMPFAGHPTIGTAALLADLAHDDGKDFSKNLCLELKAGPTDVQVARVEGRMSARLTAPIVPFHTDAKLPAAKVVAQALNLDASDIGFENHQLASIEGGPRFFFVPVKSRDALERAKPIEPHWSKTIPTMKGVDAAYVYTRGGDNADTKFRARMFAPTGGIPEDPATGSAAALVAAEILRAEGLNDGMHLFRIEQGYEMGRPSDIYLEVVVEVGKLKAVRVGGFAVRVQAGLIDI